MGGLRPSRFFIGGGIMQVKCRYCGNKIEKKNAFKDPNKNFYYCNEEHYTAAIKQKENEAKEKEEAREAREEARAEAKKIKEEQKAAAEAKRQKRTQCIMKFVVFLDMKFKIQPYFLSGFYGINLPTTKRFLHICRRIGIILKKQWNGPAIMNMLELDIFQLS